MNWADNIILATDSYKVTHHDLYPPGTEKIYSYFESRGGPWSTVFFGLQYYLKQYLVGSVVTKEKIDEAADYFTSHFGTDTYFNRSGWEHILNKHGGFLPVHIKAVPEGEIVSAKNVLMTIENTDPFVPWLTNYLETILVQVWYACTVASQSRAMKRILYRYLCETGDPSLIDFKLHDFGMRGVSSVESAGLGGCAHLVNFLGTDTMAAIQVACKFYHCPMAGFSIKASEHSTITSWGEENEENAFRNMLHKTPTDKLMACVSDSYNIWRALSEYWGGTLRDEIMNRSGTVVVRPDSGDPLVVLPKVFDILGANFPSSVNSKGYRVLDPHIRVIQGDGIEYSTLDPICKAVKNSGWSLDNLAFGSGGGLLQKLNRDTLKYAFKCSQVTINGEERDVWKKPITDSGKESKRGRLKLIKQLQTKVKSSLRENNYSTTDSLYGDDVMEDVFLNGELLRDQTLDDIRQRSIFSENEIKYA